MTSQTGSKGQGERSQPEETPAMEGLKSFWNANTLLIDLKLQGPEQFRPFIQHQIDVWGRVVRENGLKDAG